MTSVMNKTKQCPWKDLKGVYSSLVAGEMFHRIANPDTIYMRTDGEGVVNLTTGVFFVPTRDSFDLIERVYSVLVEKY